VREITLLGQIVDRYGKDVPDGPNLTGLLRILHDVDGIERIRFLTSHPNWMTGELLEAVASLPKLCPHIEVPVQAGDNEVLAAMHRGYTAERYLEKLAAARVAVADLAVSTDIIVGFPGETEADFEGTLAVAAEAEYDFAYTFIFSPRPGTEAATMTDRFVDPAVSGERFERLRVVVERSALARHRARVGRVDEVLVEGPSKKDPAVTTGRTRQGKLVHFRPERPVRPGAYADVEITGAAPHHLTGRLVDVTAEATHRTRIPVVAG